MVIGGGRRGRKVPALEGGGEEKKKGLGGVCWLTKYGWFDDVSETGSIPQFGVLYIAHICPWSNTLMCFFFNDIFFFEPAIYFF